jgi:HK97 family phage prohead protease
VTTLEAKRFAAVRLKDGHVSARFSTDRRDTVGDIVLSTAFTPGQEIPISSWGHRWDKLPVGRGVVHVEPHGARIEGEFFSHPEALATRDVLKALGDLGAWSFGFSILEAHDDLVDGLPTRIISALQVHEASPVLIPANPFGTGTLSVRGPVRGQEPPWKREMRRAYARYVLQPEIAALEKEIAQQEELQRLAAASRVRDAWLGPLVRRAG